jgi:hypothetical protein
LARRESGE